MCPHYLYNRGHSGDNGDIIGGDNMTGDMCTQCGDKPKEKGRSKCSACRKSAQRGPKEVSPEEVVSELQTQTPSQGLRSVQAPQARRQLSEPDSTKVPLATPHNPRHAMITTKGAAGAVMRTFRQNGNQVTQWVIPGGHYIGKHDPIWSECINPTCPTDIIPA